MLLADLRVIVGEKAWRRGEHEQITTLVLYGVTRHTFACQVSQLPVPCVLCLFGPCLNTVAGVSTRNYRIVPTIGNRSMADVWPPQTRQVGGVNMVSAAISNEYKEGG